MFILAYLVVCRDHRYKIWCSPDPVKKKGPGRAKFAKRVPANAFEADKTRCFAGSAAAARGPLARPGGSSRRRPDAGRAAGGDERSSGFRRIRREVALGREGRTARFPPSSGGVEIFCRESLQRRPAAGAARQNST